MSELQKQILSKETTFERIFAHFMDESVKLTPKEEQIRERWDAAFSLLLNYHSTEQAANIMKSKYGISRAQAYRDVQNATRLFGDISKAHKEGIRHILYEYSMKVFQMAANCKPPDLDQMNKSITNMMKIKGLDKDDPDIPAFEHLQQHIYNIVMDAKVLGLPEIPNLEEVIEQFKKKKLSRNLNISDAEIVK
jgi:hypothetical protein